MKPLGRLGCGCCWESVSAYFKRFQMIPTYKLFSISSASTLGARLSVFIRYCPRAELGSASSSKTFPTYVLTRSNMSNTCSIVRSRLSMSVVTACVLSSRSRAPAMSSSPLFSASPYLTSYGTGMKRHESAARSAVTPIGAEMYVCASTGFPASVESVRCTAGWGKVPSPCWP